MNAPDERQKRGGRGMQPPLLPQFLSVITSITPFFLVAADHDTRRVCVGCPVTGRWNSAVDRANGNGHVCLGPGGTDRRALSLEYHAHVSALSAEPYSVSARMTEQLPAIIPTAPSAPGSAICSNLLTRMPTTGKRSLILQFLESPAVGAY